MTYSTVPVTGRPGARNTVADLMHPGVVTIPAALPLAAAVRRMATRRVHAVLACDEHNAPVGWITTRGLLRNAPRDWGRATAGDAASEDVVTVTPGTTLQEAVQQFLLHDVSHLVVCDHDGGAVVGVLADFDLLGAITP